MSYGNFVVFGIFCGPVFMFKFLHEILKPVVLSKLMSKVIPSVTFK